MIHRLTNNFKAFGALILAGALPAVTLAASNSGLVTCGTSANPAPCDWAHLLTMVNGIIHFLLFDFSMPIAAIAFMYAGFLYMTSAGDMSKVKKAHDIFRNVLIGIFFAFGAWLIVVGILTGLGVDKSFYSAVVG